MCSFMNLQYNMPQFFGSFGNCACAPSPYYIAYSNPISCFSAYPQLFTPQYTLFNMPLFSVQYPLFNLPKITMPQINTPKAQPLFNIDYTNNIFKYTPRKSLTDNVKTVDYAQRFLDRTARANSNLLDLARFGYNSNKGNRLAQIVSRNATGFTGYCAKSVKDAIEQAGLGKYENGHAFECINILRKNPNFKEISATGLNLKNLPAGCILVYDRGVAGYSSEYGHIEITDGKGSAISDGITTNIRSGAKVFIPV